MDSSARIVADADVLAADLLVGGDARAALDHVRRHDWLTLVASEQLLGDADPAGDHPGLASAYRGEAAHLLTYDDSLRSARTGLSIQPHADLSARPPDAFARLFDPKTLYEATHDDDYPGPDRESRD